jgi:alkylated DNA repair dioxygenase AlkB
MFETKFGGSLYCKNFLEKDYIQPLEDSLLKLDWETKRTARHEYFMSDNLIKYSYGNRMGAEEYISKPMTGMVGNLMNLINVNLKSNLNACFLNKYDDEKQHLGWHADDFQKMSGDEPITVVSFGAEREIWLKNQEDKGNIPDDQKILLNRGSLFIMPAFYQEDNFHKIPKHNRPCGWRISLTFRSFK